MRTNEGDSPLFCASDVAKALGYVNPAKAVIDHCKGVSKIETPTHNQYGAVVMQGIKYIKESDVFRLIMKSKLPYAEQFQDWVCEEVLPSIRKTGGYMVAHNDDTPEMIMARAILVANDTIERQKKKIAQQAAKIEADAPYVDYAESIMKVDGDLDMQSVARVLADNDIKDNHGKPIGRTYLFKVLRDNFILMSDNRPYQKYVDKTYFGCYIHHIDTGWNVKIRYVPTMTPKGLKWFLEQIDKGKLKGIGK